MSHPPFSNILLCGPCNLHCPACIGKKLSRQYRSTLDLWPLPGLREFTSALRARSIHQVSLTGVDTDPLLYRHQPQLAAWLRAQVPGVSISLHTNAVLLQRRPALLSLYDRATISIPSFRRSTYEAMTGCRTMPDWSRILQDPAIPIKVSVLLTDINSPEIPDILERCSSLGIRRLVFRRLYPASGPWNPLPALRPVRYHGSNPVYQVADIEITLWDFERTSLRCLNLYPDGSLCDSYLLENHDDKRPAPRAPTAEHPRTGLRRSHPRLL